MVHNILSNLPQDELLVLQNNPDFVTARNKFYAIDLIVHRPFPNNWNVVNDQTNLYMGGINQLTNLLI